MWLRYTRFARFAWQILADETPGTHAESMHVRHVLKLFALMMNNFEAFQRKLAYFTTG